MDNVKRFAAHEIRMPDGECLVMGVVEVVDGTVKTVYPLEDEQAQTVWLGGTIVIRQEGENLKAYKSNKPI